MCQSEKKQTLNGGFRHRHPLSPSVPCAFPWSELLCGSVPDRACLAYCSGTYRASSAAVHPKRTLDSALKITGNCESRNLTKPAPSARLMARLGPFGKQACTFVSKWPDLYPVGAMFFLWDGMPLVHVGISKGLHLAKFLRGQKGESTVD